MTDPGPLTPADRAAIAARVEAVQEFWGRGTWAGHSERVALETALITQDVPRLLAALAAAEAERDGYRDACALSLAEALESAVEGPDGAPIFAPERADRLEGMVERLCERGVDLQQRIAALEALLRRYGWHAVDCAYRLTLFPTTGYQAPRPPHACTCGWAATREELGDG